MASKPTSDGGGVPASGRAQPRDAPRSIRFRAIVLIAILVPISVFFMVWNSWVAGGGGAADSLIGPAVAALSILIAVYVAVKRWRPRWVLSSGELVAVYAALVISIGMTVSVWDWGASVATVMTWPIWNAGPENQWRELMWPNLPAWLIVADRDALSGFFLGDANPYRREALLAWLQPALWWTAWASALLWVSLCLNVIVRRRWSQEEQLSFPMTILPLQMIDPKGRLFANPLWWAGLFIAAGISLLSLVAHFFPAVPAITTSVDLSAHLANNRPWDALRTPFLDWEPWHIGLSYLMPADLAFSLIVFNLFWRAEYVVGRLLGWTTSPWAGFPYGDQQSLGGYLALIVVVLWLDRRYLLQVMRRALGLSSAVDDSEEAFSYRTAVCGGLVGVGFLWYFLARGGMGPAVVGGFLILYFAMAMVMSRMRAHLGPPNNEMYGAMPEFALTEYPGTRAMGSRGLGMLALLRPYMGEQRPNPAPAQLEALRMAERAPADPRRLAWIMMAVVPLAMLSYFWASIHIGYNLGLGTANVDRSIVFVARGASEKLDSWLRTPAGPNWSGVEAMGIGFAGTIMLMALKLQFPAWPLHPVAFPLAFTFPIDAMLPAIIASWSFKALLLRYGGLRAHRRALPFFLGLLVGSAVVGLLRLIALRALGLS